MAVNFYLHNYHTIIIRIISFSYSTYFFLLAIVICHGNASQMMLMRMLLSFAATAHAPHISLLLPVKPLLGLISHLVIVLIIIVSGIKGGSILSSSSGYYCVRGGVIIRGLAYFGKVCLRKNMNGHGGQGGVVHVRVLANASHFHNLVVQGPVLDFFTLGKHPGTAEPGTAELDVTGEDFVQLLFQVAQYFLQICKKMGD